MKIILNLNNNKIYLEFINKKNNYLGYYSCKSKVFKYIYSDSRISYKYRYDYLTSHKRWHIQSHELFLHFNIINRFQKSLNTLSFLLNYI